MNKLGCHITFSKATNYLTGAVETAIKYGCNTMMIFMGPPHTTARVDISLYNKDLYMNTRLKDQIKPEDIIAHGPYIINPASPAKSQFSIDFLISEMKRLDYIGGKIMVLHPGSNPNKVEGLKTVANVVKKALEAVPNISIALETMAGKGNEIGRSFQELAIIIKEINNPRAGICLDTCHTWDAGYDIKNNFDEVLEEFNMTIGLEKLFVIHLNDSKNQRSAHMDRHENIGKGYLGLEACRKVYKNKRIENVPKILETPWVGEAPIYKEEIALLKG